MAAGGHRGPRHEHDVAAVAAASGKRLGTSKTNAALGAGAWQPATVRSGVTRRPLGSKGESALSQQVSRRGVGGASFAGTLLIIGGVLWMVEGFAGIVRGTSYLENESYWITTSAATWGWIHLIGGIIGLAAGFGVFPERPGRVCWASSLRAFR